MNPPRARTVAACLDSARDEIHHIAKLEPIREQIDWDCLNRMAAWAAKCRAEMGEERWAELDKEPD